MKSDQCCDPMFKKGDLVIYICFQFLFTASLPELLAADRVEERPDDPPVKKQRVKRAKLIEVEETASHTLTTETETITTIVETYEPSIERINAEAVAEIADMRAKPHPFAPLTAMFHLSDKGARQLLAEAELIEDGDMEVDGTVSRWANFCDEAANQTHEGMSPGEVLTKPYGEFTKATSDAAAAIVTAAPKDGAAGLAAAQS